MIPILSHVKHSIYYDCTHIAYKMWKEKICCYTNKYTNMQTLEQKCLRTQILYTYEYMYINMHTHIQLKDCRIFFYFIYLVIAILKIKLGNK